MSKYRVGTAGYYNRKTGNFIATAYLRDVDRPGRMVFEVDADTGKDAKKIAAQKRRDHERARATATVESIYRLRNDDPRFGLKAGDMLVCESMHWAWAPEKIAVKHRLADGYEPECSQYRGDVEYVSGPRL